MLFFNASMLPKAVWAEVQNIQIPARVNTPGGLKGQDE
jgi:hypothetical protein